MMAKKLPEDSTWNGVTKSYNGFKRNMYSWIGGGALILFAMVGTYMFGKVDKNEAEINTLKIKAAVINTKLDTIQKATERIERRLNGNKT